MPLVPLRPILDATDTYDCAQGAFNVNEGVRTDWAIEGARGVGDCVFSGGSAYTIPLDALEFRWKEGI